MNKKTIFIILAIVFLLIDLAFSGKYPSLKIPLLFPIFYFMLLANFPKEDLLIPGLLYGFLFDVSSFTFFPKMALIIVGIFFLSRLLAKKFIDTSQTVSLYLLSIIISLLCLLIPNINAIRIVNIHQLFIIAAYNLVFSSLAFFVFDFVINRYTNPRINENKKV